MSRRSRTPTSGAPRQRSARLSKSFHGQANVGTDKKAAMSVSFSPDNATPRGLIQSFLNQGAEEQTTKRTAMGPPLARTPRRKSQRLSLSKQAMLNTLIDNSVVAEDTPRTLIQGMLNHGVEETPARPMTISQQAVPDGVSYQESYLGDQTLAEEHSMNESSFLPLTQPSQDRFKGSRHRVVQPTLRDFSIVLDDMGDTTAPKSILASKSDTEVSRSRFEESVREDSFMAASQPSQPTRRVPQRKSNHRDHMVDYAKDLRQGAMWARQGTSQVEMSGEPDQENIQPGHRTVQDVEALDQSWHVEASTSAGRSHFRKKVCPPENIHSHDDRFHQSLGLRRSRSPDHAGRVSLVQVEAAVGATGQLSDSMDSDLVQPSQGTVESTSRRNRRSASNSALHFVEESQSQHSLQLAGSLVIPDTQPEMETDDSHRHSPVPSHSRHSTIGKDYQTHHVEDLGEIVISDSEKPEDGETDIEDKEEMPDISRHLRDGAVSPILPDQSVDKRTTVRSDNISDTEDREAEGPNEHEAEEPIEQDADEFDEREADESDEHEAGESDEHEAGEPEQREAEESIEHEADEFDEREAEESVEHEAGEPDRQETEEFVEHEAGEPDRQETEEFVEREAEESEHEAEEPDEHEAGESDGEEAEEPVRQEAENPEESDEKEAGEPDERKGEEPDEREAEEPAEADGQSDADAEGPSFDTPRLPLKPVQVNHEPLNTPGNLTTAFATPPVRGHGRGRGRGRGTARGASTAAGRGRQGSRDTRSSLPMPLTKRIFQHFCKHRVTPGAWTAIEQLTEVYWKHAVRDLTVYAQHADRTGITEADVELLMKRQRFINDKESLNSLIEKYLPLEYRSLLIPIARSGNRIDPK